ncbi:hypothetical protein EDD18DRAFT_1110704 [Armillaria luteobubalina]|uniref:Uncharacterized protein n=1 Tax=Armillaria luteobubalina TaxID=153913 RepID=A0AA39UHU1_9AGAR|nr:hypothetical protein EDD18DRAFT_1110704 [Armillaria luteobubalina]
MSLRIYFLHVGLQAWDPFFGDYNKIYTRSASINDEYLAKVLLEAKRRYSNILITQQVDKLSIFCGWHLSLNNLHYHYTLRGYNPQGWMAVTLEMEGGNQGLVFTYQARHWNRWLVRAGGQAQLKAKHFFDPVDHVEERSWARIVYLACRGHIV